MYEIAIGDNANFEAIPVGITYSCVEGSTIHDITRFQFRDLNHNVKIVHLSAGHCDICHASLATKRGANFDVEMNQIIHNYTNLILSIREKTNASLTLYPLRDPKTYVPVCAKLRPLFPNYESGVKQLNAYIKGWGRKLNFTTIAQGI